MPKNVILSKKDLVTLVQEDLKTMKIYLNEEEISKTKKSVFKNMVKKHVKDATFTQLKEMQKEHTKINTIKYNAFKMQPYLDSDLLNSEEISMLFNMRANTVNGFKMCFTSMHRYNLWCKLGCQETDSLDHCMNCQSITNKTGKKSKFSFDLIFSTVKEQKTVVTNFISRMFTRNKIIEEEQSLSRGGNQ